MFKTGKRSGLLCVLTAMLLFVTMPALAEETATALPDASVFNGTLRSVWEHYQTSNSTYDSNTTHEMTPPYLYAFFLENGYFYMNDGRLDTYTFSTSTSEAYNYTSANGTYGQKGTYGWRDMSYSTGSTTIMDFHVGAAVTLFQAVQPRVTVQAEAFVTGEEVLVDVSTDSLTGMTAPYQTSFHVFDELPGSDIKNQLISRGSPETLIFDEPGRYLVFGNATDSNNQTSRFHAIHLDIAEGPTTEATISNYTDLHSRMAEGDNLEWEITVENGGGEYRQYVYLYKDGEYLSRHVIEGLRGSIPIAERGTYQLKYRVKDLATGGYTGFHSTQTFTVYPVWNYTVLTDDSGAESIRLDTYNSYNPEVVVPEVYEGYPVTEVGRSVFNHIYSDMTSLTWASTVPVVPAFSSQFSNLETLTLPEGVVEIASGTNNYYGAFRYAKKLTSVVLPDTFQTIGDNAFTDCTGLVSVTLGEQTETIGRYTFNNCEKLSEIQFGTSLKTIGDGAFDSCDALETLILPEGLTTIGSNAFGYTSLKRLEMPDSVTSVASNNFSYLSDTLTYVRWPAGVPVVPAETFNGYKLLETVILPEGVTELTGSSYGVFGRCESLKTIVLPDTLKVIGGHTFTDCTALTSVTLGAQTETIDYSAFYRCTALSEINFGTSLKTIGSMAFHDCTSLETVILPEGVTEIGSNAFASSGVKHLELPDTVTTLGGALTYSSDPLTYLRWTAGIPVVPESKFSSFAQLETVILPEGVTELGSRAFNDCAKLKAIDLPDTLKIVGSSAFYSCDALETVQLGEQTETIGSQAFSYCTALSGIEFGKSLKTIGSSAFSYCTALETVILPEGVTEIGSGAFGSSGVKHLELPDTVTTLGGALTYSSDQLTYLRWTAGIPEVPSQKFQNFALLETVILPEGVTSIGSYAFDNCAKLTTIDLPDTLKTIGSSAFSGCKALPAIKLGEQTESIGSQAFSGCTVLSEITFGASLKTIGSSAFSYCTALEEMVLPDGLQTVDVSAFANTSISRLVLPDSVTSLAKSAVTDLKSTLVSVRWPAGVTVVPSQQFMDFALLETVVLPEGVTEIDSSAFFCCLKLSSVTLPDTLVTVDSYAFKDCTALSAVKLGAGTETIGSYAFQNCTLLSEIDLGTSLKTINGYAFSGCAALGAINLPESLTTIESYAFENTAIQHLSLPDSLTTLNSYALTGMKDKLVSVRWSAGLPVVNSSRFSGFAQLESVELPEGVTEIDSAAFCNCTALTSIALPDTLKTIDSGAFSGCTALREVSFGPYVESVGYQAFSNCTALEELVLPCGIATVDITSFPKTVAFVCAPSARTTATFTAKGYTVNAPQAALTLPASLNTVEAEAFLNNTAQLVVIPEGCVSIGAKAFAGMGNLLYVELPKSVQSIAPDAFEGVELLGAVVAEESYAMTYGQQAGLPVSAR